VNVDADIAVLGPGEDRDEAAGLLKRFFAEEGFTTPPKQIEDNLRHMLELDVCRVLVARDGLEMIGVATVSLDFGIEFGWAGEIGDLYVVPAARGRGVARALVQVAARLARQQGATALSVTVTGQGEASGLKDFYARLGFRDDGRRILMRGVDDLE
jgi:aminoglycoside 6'-N-acetyltransferase I